MPLNVSCNHSWKNSLLETESKSSTFRHGLRNISLSTGIDNGEEEKIMRIYIFYSCLEWHANYLWH